MSQAPLRIFPEMNVSKKITSTDVERLLLDVRTGQVADALVKNGAVNGWGAVVVWPCHVMAPRASGYGQGASRVEQSAALRAYPLRRLSHEPGEVFAPNTVTPISCEIEDGQGVTVTHTFHVGVDIDADQLPAEITKSTKKAGSSGLPEWTCALPTNISVQSRNSVAVNRSLDRNRRNRHSAQMQLVTYARGLVRAKYLESTSHHMNRHLATEAEVLAHPDDLVMRSIDKFASSNRPQWTWSHELYASLPRELNRGAHQYDHNSEDERNCANELSKLDLEHLVSPAAAWTALARRRTSNKVRLNNPSWSTAEIDEEVDRRAEHGRLECRYTIDRVTRVLRDGLITMQSFDTPIGDDDGLSLVDVLQPATSSVYDTHESIEAQLSDVIEALIAAAGINGTVTDVVLALESSNRFDRAGRQFVPSTKGDSALIHRHLFSPFLARGASWSNTTDRGDAARACFEAITTGDGFRSPQEIRMAYEGRALLSVTPSMFSVVPSDAPVSHEAVVDPDEIAQIDRDLDTALGMGNNPMLAALRARCLRMAEDFSDQARLARRDGDYRMRRVLLGHADHLRGAADRCCCAI